jgi:hypothetical protein
MNINQLVNTYFGQIEIKDIGFSLVDDAIFDTAYFLLNIPIAMLKEYLQLKGENKKFPNVVEFWRETGLVTS